MNFGSVFVGIIIAVLFVWALKTTIKDHTAGCSGDCSSCHSGCSSTKNGEPDWMVRYRKDHPKNKSEKITE